MRRWRIQHAESENVGLLVWRPLAGGLLSGRFSRTAQKPADSRRTEYDFPIADKERTWNILDVIAPIAKHVGVVLPASHSHGSWQSPL